jgi:hypothetical protein
MPKFEDKLLPFRPNINWYMPSRIQSSPIRMKQEEFLREFEIIHLEKLTFDLETVQSGESKWTGKQDKYRAHKKVNFMKSLGRGANASSSVFARPSNYTRLL